MDANFFIVGYGTEAFQSLDAAHSRYLALSLGVLVALRTSRFDYTHGVVLDVNIQQ